MSKVHRLDPKRDHLPSIDTRATVTPTARRPAATRGDPFPPAAAAAPRTQRGLRCDSYSRASSGVWYYQIDIEVRRVHSVEGSGSNSSSIDGFLETCDEEDVQYYSVRRRYNEFLQLYESMKAATMDRAVDHTNLPPFPQKELISSSMLGMLWRGSSPVDLLEDRRAKFQAMLRWIEAHPVLRECSAFSDFLGQPPQSSEGYVSLKEYSSQHWLSSLEQLTKEKAKRRRLSSDCSTCSVLQQEQTRRAKKRRRESQHGVPMLLSPATAGKATKRQHTYDSKSPRKHVLTSRVAKKRARACSMSSQKDYIESRDTATSLQLRLQVREAERVAQVESSHHCITKRKKI